MSLNRVGARLGQDVAALWPALQPGQDGLPSLQTVRALRRDLEILDGELRSLQRGTVWFSRPLARQTWWPWLSKWGIILGDGLAAAVDLTTTAWWAVLRVESGIENHGEINTATGVPVRMEANPFADALRSLRRNRERLLSARQRLSRVSRALDGGHGEPIPQRRWREYLELAPLAIDGLLIAADALESDRERAYLLLIQNSDELRATGGFISSVALLKLRGPKLVSLDYLNSYDVEAYRSVHPSPPAPLRKYMGAGVLLFRDANWSPDFPTSAEVLASLFQLDVGEHVDGVVALDTIFARLLLAALGPVPVPRYDVIVTADNVVDTTVGFWESPLGAPSIRERDREFRGWLDHRKDFGGALIQGVLDRLVTLSPEDTLALVQAVHQAVRGKHLLAWALDDPRLQGDLRRAGLDGGVRGSKGDYLMVVDSNMGWNKVDRHIERQIDYRLTMTDQSPRVTLCLAYRNVSDARLAECVHRARYQDSYEALTKQCYWNYVRVLAPPGSVLLRSSGADWPVDVGVESGKTSYGTLLVVPPQEERVLCLEYALPAEIVRDVASGRLRTYELLVQKQPGTTGTRFGVRVDLATEGTLRSPTEPWALLSSSKAHREDLLDSDLHYTLSWASVGDQGGRD